MTEITLIRRQDGLFSVVTETDAERAKQFKIGQGIRVKAVKLKPRSIKHHRLYWGGLLELAYDYWEPKGGLIGSTEKDTLKKFCTWLDGQSGNTGAIFQAGKAFLSQLEESRSNKIEAPEKSKDALHNWVKIEAGYYHLEQTPSGLRKVAMSINFNVMDDEQFKQFYKAAFSVCWRFILSRTFEDEQQAENAVQNLLAMG